MPTEIIIDKQYEGVSPKNYLKKRIDLPYHKIIKLLKEKRITLNGKKIKEDTKFKEGDVLKYWIEIPMRPNQTKAKANAPSKDLGIETIFENDDFIVLNKLPDVIVQGANDNGTSLALHLRYLKEKNKDDSDFSYFHVHRLDKDTSGVMLCAKKEFSLRELNKVFRERGIVKKYVCLCSGSFEKKNGEIKIKLDRTAEGAREKVIVSGKGKDTHSIYRVLKEYEYENETLSLVEVEIKTGFMHQIRVHMKYLKHPIVCDTMYGNRYVNELFSGFLGRQFLHAKYLEFKFNNEKYKLEATLTDDLQKCLSKLEVRKV